MDIKLEKKPWYIRYRYYLAGGVAFLAFLIYVVTLSLGPSKLRIEQDNIQIAEVKNGKFMEYVDVEGVIQPILTIKVNAREAGSVERIIGEEGPSQGKFPPDWLYAPTRSFTGLAQYLPECHPRSGNLRHTKYCNQKTCV